jgi:ATP synthase F1 delta subunit
LAVRYARAYDGVSKNNEEARINLQAYISALNLLKEAAVYINNPAISLGVKQKLISKIILRGKAADFIKLLVLKKRFALAWDISAQLQNLLDLRLGVKRVNIVFAREIPQEQKLKLQDVLKDFFKSEVSLNYDEDKKLLCGIQIRHGDTLIDASALGRIKQMSKELARKN